ncbi:hypothetical protein R1sor_023363 [Riccia sorocarpa]|uniref:Uncharacterized protein n=1 Tax=Riccia sorocarpa TaxID=122646 RepID=A0ABD3GQF2_9MARC
MRTRRRKDKHQTERQKNQEIRDQNETVAIEVNPEPLVEVPINVVEDDIGGETSAPKEDSRRAKRSKKQAYIQKVFEGKFREDVYFPMKNICVVVKGSLRDTHEKLQGNKGKSVKDPVPIIEHLTSICSSLETRRLAGFQMNNKQAQATADCLYLDLSSGLKIHPDDLVPAWNVFPDEDDLPRKLMGLGRSILDDRGCLMILHQGTLRNAQQIADALDAYSQVW